MRNLVVDLGALRQNVRALKAAMGVTPIYGVCKGNGFGMGLVPFAKTLAEEGIETLAVASIDDAVALREAGLACDILMLSSTSLPDEARRLVALDLIASLGSVAAIETLERAAAQAGKPARRRGDRLALFDGALVVPQDRAADDLMSRIERDHAVHLPGKADPANFIAVQLSAHLFNRRTAALPPVLGVLLRIPGLRGVKGIGFQR